MLSNSRFLFVLVFCGYLQFAYSMMPHPDMPAGDRRVVVHFAVDNDPCKSLDAWEVETEDPDDKVTGEDVCKEVLVYFKGLDDDEKKGCPKAGDAHCQCQGFFKEPRCTFMCDIEEVDWTAPPVKKSRGSPFERQKKTERKPRTLPIIAAHVFNPENPSLPQRPLSPPKNKLTGSRLGPFRVDGTLKADKSRKRKSPEH